MIDTQNIKQEGPVPIELSKGLDELFTESEDKICVALVRKEKLVPVTRKGSVIFPPTYLVSEEQGEKGESDYVIDTTPEGDVVLIDSVESQANRMEELFLPEGPYANLVPQITINIEKKDGLNINLIKAPHRIADALVRFSTLREKAGEALRKVENENDYLEVARISPFSLLFGAWDSRGVSSGRVKIPRALTSTVRGYNVFRLRRGYAYTPALRLYMGQDEIEEALEKADNKGMSEEGMAQAAGTVKQGGVVVKGDIIRESVLSFVALRNLRAGNNAELTKKLRKYITSLGLLCLVSRLPAEYRSGCILVPEPGSETFEAVYNDGSKFPVKLTLEDAIQLCKDAKFELFGEQPPRETYSFSWGDAKKAVGKKEGKRAQGGEGEG